MKWGIQMKLLFKERLFSWLDSYDIFDEYGEVVYRVEGQLSFGHTLHINDAYDRHIGTVKQVLLSWLPKFEIYENDVLKGYIEKELTFFKAKYHLDFLGWHIDGDLFEWDYQILDEQDEVIATITKELFNFTDTYSIEITKKENALYALMVVLAIDAEKCSRN